MSSSTYSASWQLQVEPSLDMFRSYEDDFPPFAKWQSDWSPDRWTNQLLIESFTLLYAGNPEGLSEKFIDWVISRIDRALAEKKFDHPRAAYPQNRGHGLRARAHATFLRDGTLEQSDLAQAIEDFDEYNRGIQRHLWDAQSEADVLAPARLSLIAGDLDRFADLLPYRFPMKWHQEEADLLASLHGPLARSEPFPSTLVDDFVSYFHRVRDPEFNPDIYTEKDILRFELGLLYCQYIDPTEALTPRRVIDVISQ